MSSTTDTTTNYHWATIVGSSVGGLGLAGSLVTIMISLTLGNAAVPVGLSGISSSLAVGGLLIAIVRLAARPQWVVDRMDAQDRKLEDIRTAVDSHAHHVEREHGGLHEDAVDIGEQLAELRALVAGLRHQLQPEQPDAPERPEQQHHVSRQRKQRRRRSGSDDGDTNVIPLRARRAAEALRRLSEHIKDDPAGK